MLTQAKKTDSLVTVPKFMKLVLGGSAGMSASVVVQPFDLVKTRMQLSGLGGAKKEFKNSLECVVAVVKPEGFSGLYKGMTANLLRQAMYGSGRLGVYSYLNEKFIQQRGKKPSLMANIAISNLAGASGAFIGTPAEIAMVRMQADGRLPKNQQRGYSNVFNALVRIVREEGTGTLLRGCVPTVIRAMIVNMAQLTTYSQAKNLITQSYNMKDGLQLHFYSAMLSGIVTTIASMPVDIAKTRVQNMRCINGRPEYAGALDALAKLTKQEGFFALWKGFATYYARLGPHTVLIFLFLEQFNKMYFKYVLGAAENSSI